MLFNQQTTGIKLAHTVSAYTPQNTTMDKAIQILSRKKTAFTLAETLITLTIIGVIAAMTVPTLMTNYQKQTYVTGLKKAYSVLSQAAKLIPLENNCSSGDFDCVVANVYPDENLSSVKDGGINIIAPLLKTVKVEPAPIEHECNSVAYTTDGGCAYTADGMWFGSSAGFNIGVDVNGGKGPNLYGKDRFRFVIAHEDVEGIPNGTVIPYGSSLFYKYVQSSNDNNGVDAYSYKKTSSGRAICEAKTLSKSGNHGAICTAQILEDGKMDY